MDRSHLLVENEDLALKVLSELSKNNSTVEFTAQMTINEWKKGNLTYLIE